jgi:hypothetical protein
MDKEDSPPAGPDCIVSGGLSGDPASVSWVSDEDRISSTSNADGPNRGKRGPVKVRSKGTGRKVPCVGG